MSDTPKSTFNWLSWLRYVAAWFLIEAAVIFILFVGLSAWGLAHSKGGLMQDSGHRLTSLLGEVFGTMFVFFLGTWLKKLKPRVVLSPTGGAQWVCYIIGALLMVFAGWTGFVMLFGQLARFGMHNETAVMAQTVKLGMIIIGGAGLVAMVLGVLLLRMAESKTADESSEAGVPATLAIQKPKIIRNQSKRWQSCNVLQVGLDSCRLWSFNAGRGGFNLNQQQDISGADPLPANLVARDWKTLFQPRLNIGWLPVDQVFLRVAQLPAGSFEETLAMVELQLEKLSPLPVTQIVWSIEVMPQHVGDLQTVVVTIIARDLAEKFLGELEGKGFLADRLELSMLDQILATRITENGAYIYPYSGTDKFSALTAWWQDGVLCNIGIVHVPAVDNKDAILWEQLSQMAWSGELEGWLKSEPRWHLVADSTAAANWQPLFQPWLGHAVATLDPLPEPQLAAVNANRAAHAPTESGMLPVEFARRYTQEFHDRLWTRALGTCAVAYVCCVMIYMAISGYRGAVADNAEHDTAINSHQYTNALQLKAQLQILQNRQALKYASLDCWRVTAELLPEGITVQNMDFKDGKHYSLSGVATSDKSGELTDFNENMRKATNPHGELVFETMTVPNVKLNPGGTTVSWSFSGELARAEELR